MPNLDKAKLVDCNKGTPAGKIAKWISILRDLYALQCNGYPITSITDLHQAIDKTKGESIKILFSKMEK